MANSPNEPPRGTIPPTDEEADRLAERFRPSWEVDDAVVPDSAVAPALEVVPPLPPGMAAVPAAHTPPPPPLVASPPPLAVRPDTLTLPANADVAVAKPPGDRRKQTLLGIQPNEVPRASSHDAARTGIPKGTLVGIGVPETVRSAAPAPALAPLTREEPSNPLNDVFDVSDAGHSPAAPEVYALASPIGTDLAAPPPETPSGAAEEPPQPDVVSPKPTGVAKIYHPKDGPNTPAVVVAPTALAEAPAVPQPRRRASRSQQTPTIPGTLRALQSPAADVDVEDFAPRRSKLPLVIGVSLLLGVGAAMAAFTLVREKDTPAPVLAVKEAPATASVTTAAAPEPDQAPIPPPPEVAPTDVALPATASAAPAPPEPVQATPAPEPPPKVAFAPAPPKVKETPRKTAAPVTSPVRKPQPKRAPASGTPAKSKAVIVRESPF